MASSSGSGTTSASSLLPNSGSEGDLQAVMDQRKRKRMQLNRESARRSRMRKQKHLDELMIQVAEMRKQNSQILTTLNITTQHYLGVDAENSVLKTQMMELSSRLQSLTEILHFLNGGSSGPFFDPPPPPDSDDGFMRPWSMMLTNQHPIMASVDMFQYC